MEEDKEIWKTVEGFETIEVSNYGRVRAIERDFIDSWGRKYHKDECILKLTVQKQGSYNQVMVGFTYNKKTYRKIVARLVAKAFVPNPNNYPQVNHIDENSENNYYKNLEWCTCKYNINYGECITRRARSKCIPIDVYDSNHNFIETLPSGVEVHKKYNMDKSYISYACKTGCCIKGYYLKKH